MADIFNSQPQFTWDAVLSELRTRGSLTAKELAGGLGVGIQDVYALTRIMFKAGVINKGSGVATSGAPIRYRLP